MNKIQMIKFREPEQMVDWLNENDNKINIVQICTLPAMAMYMGYVYFRWKKYMGFVYFRWKK